MFIEKIEITNFRNINSLNTEFGNKYNVFFGKNAQGKTNLLEALSVALNGASHREKSIANFINNESENACIFVNVKKEDDIDTFVKCTIGEKRKYEINNSPISTRAQLLSEYNMVLFTPEDLKIVKGHPADRRRFLDESISLIYPNYHTALRKYNKALKQRNSLLKDYSMRNVSSGLLDVYDDTLCSIGSDIIKTRISVLRRIGRIANELNKEVAKEENISFFYASNILDQNVDIKNIRELYEKKLKEAKNEDLRRGTTTVGIHHDDINIFINGLDTKKFASQGQQRSIALCMKLSLIEILYDKYEDYPIVLLDDVMSDLDKYRQSQIMNLIKNTQSFITCVNYSFLDNKNENDYRIYRIEKGKVIGGK